MTDTPRKERRYLTAADVERLGMASYRQIDHWCRTYDLNASTGKGTNRLFTYTEARMAAALGWAGDHGVSLSMYARPMLAALRAQPLASHLVLSNRQASAHVNLDRALDAVRHAGSNACTVVPIPLEVRP